jgi:hypothetical protein
MPSRNVPDGQIEIFFARADRSVVLEWGEEDIATADVIVAALALEDPDETEDRLRSDVGALGVVRRRP